MTSVDLYAEFHRALIRASRQREALDGHGWTWEVAARIGGVGLARVAVSGDRYVPDDDGVASFIVPAWDGAINDSRTPLCFASEVIDLIAWHPLRRYALPSRCGNAAVLGELACFPSMLHDEPLRLFRSPLAWAQAGGEDAGAVIVDWPSCGFLLDGRPIQAEDEQHARAVAAQLERLRARRTPKIPRIAVRAGP